MKRLALFTAIVFITIISVIAIWQMQPAVLLLLLALALAAALAPDVERLISYGLGRIAAVSVTFGVALLALTGMLLFFGSLVATEVVQAIIDLPAWYETTRQVLVTQSGWQGHLGTALPTIDAIMISLAESDPGNVSQFLFGLTINLVTVGTLLFSVGALSFYWQLQQQHLERLWLSLLPLSARTSARLIWAQVYREVGMYIRSGAVIVALTVMTLLSVYVLLELPVATLLALVGGLAQVIPLLGLPIAIIPAVIVALTQSTLTAVLTLILTLTLLSVVQLVVVPHLLRDNISINPVLLIFLIMALAAIGGVVLILFAPPLAAALQVVYGVLTEEQLTTLDDDPQTDQIQSLQTQLTQIEERLASEPEPDPRLQDMLERARQLLADAGAVAEGV